MYHIDRNINRKGLKLSDLQNPSNSVNFYKEKKVRKHLVLCYGRKCCYCEAIIPSTAYIQIDHFYPKGTTVLPAQFQGNQNLYNQIVNDIRNYHVACARCNILKSDFVGESLSPNFYHDGNQWLEFDDQYIQNNIKYNGARVECTPRYKDFCDKLKMNGWTTNEKVGLHSSSRLDRTLYLEETKRLLHVVMRLYDNGEYEDAKELLGIIENRFEKKAHYSKMIVRNLGTAFIKLKADLKNH